MDTHSWQRSLIALGEIGAALVTVSAALFVTCRWFAPAMLRADVRKELLQGNVAVSIVLGALIACPTLVVLSTLGPIIYHVRTHFLVEGQGSAGLIALFGIAIGYVAAVLALALGTTWIALRIFAALTKGIDEMAEVRRGNVAVAILLAAVIAVVAFFTQVGISALGGSLVPQTPLGEIKVMR